MAGKFCSNQSQHSSEDETGSEDVRVEEKRRGSIIRRRARCRGQGAESQGCCGELFSGSGPLLELGPFPGWLGAAVC